jgi:hypothetical protein
MPTTAEHRQEALALTYSVQALTGVCAAVDSCDRHLGFDGGVVAPLVHRAFEATHANVTHVGRHVAALIDELHRRAALCEQFTDDWRRYESRHARWVTELRRWRDTQGQLVQAPWPGPEPVPPTPPFPGAAVG